MPWRTCDDRGWRDSWTLSGHPLVGEPTAAGRQRVFVAGQRRVSSHVLWIVWSHHRVEREEWVSMSRLTSCVLGPHRGKSHTTSLSASWHVVDILSGTEFVPCLHDWSHCGSSLCLVRFIVIAMSRAHVEWLSSTSPCTSTPISSSAFLPAPFFYILDVVWISTTHSSAEELGHPDKTTPPQVEPNNHLITETYVECT